MDYFNDISVKEVEGETHLQIVAKKACKIISHIQTFLNLQERRKHQKSAMLWQKEEHLNQKI